MSMMASAWTRGTSSAYSVRWPGRVVRKPNSILSCRCTGTLVTVSAKGNFRCGPGSVVRAYAPNRWTTPTSSGSTW